MIGKSSSVALGAVRKMTAVTPSLLGAACAVGVLAVSALTEQADPTFALVAALLLSTCAIGFTLDDEAAVTLAASPTTIRRRRGFAASLGLPPIFVAWCGALAVAGRAWPELHVNVVALAVEITALTLLALAMAARWGGAAASIGAPVSALVLSVFAIRINGLPSLQLGSRWHERWLLVALAALAWFVFELRDPAAAAFPDRK